MGNELEDKIKQLEEELKQEKKTNFELTEIIKNIPSALYEQDLKTFKFSYFNNTLLNKLGYTKKEFEKLDPSQIIHPEDLKKYMQNIKTTIEDNNIKEQTKYRVFTKSGNILWTSLDMKIIYEGQNPVKIAVIAQDITPLIKQKRKIQESLQRFISLAESSIDPIYQMDLTFKFTCTNKAYEDRINIEKGKNKYWDYHNEETDLAKKFKEKIEFVKRTGKSIVYIYQSSKDEKYFLRTINPIFGTNNKNVKEVTVFSKDITELRKKEEKLNNSLKFIAGLSHNLRSPFNTIIGFTELLKKESIKLKNQTLEEYANIANKQSLGLLKIINNIITYTRNQAHEIKLEYTNIDLKDKFETYKQTGKELVRGENNKDISITTKTNHHSIIKTDMYVLDQIMINLISNAVKYTNKGNIEIGLDTINDMLKFYVKDTGVGVPQELKKDIFIPTKIVGHKDGRSNYESTGLGLGISKDLVEKLGGEIWVESEEKRGSTFYFTIPNLLKQEQRSSKLNYNTILIVDDIEINSQLLEIYLNKINKEYNILITKDGEKAVELFKKQMPGIVYMDLVLEGSNISGIEASKEIQQVGSPKIIAYTSNQDLYFKNRKNFTEILFKPVRFEHFKEQFKQINRNRKPFK